MKFTLYDDFMSHYRERLMKKSIVLFLLVHLLSACSHKPTTQIDFNQEVNFALFSTYQFSTQQNNSIDDNPIMINRIQSAVESALTNKGLQRHPYMNNKSAELTITVTFSQNQLENNSSFTIGLGTSRVGSNSMGSIGLSTSIPIDSESDIITNIMIDISDDKHAIWHGSGSYEASSNLTIEEIDKAVTDTVDRILKDFPPLATK